MSDLGPFGDRLRPGENLVWTGTPSPGIILTGRAAFLIPFSAIWLGFVIFWTWGVLKGGGGAFALFGVVFLVVGVFFTVGRFLLDAWLRRGAQYAITERRVLI